MPFEVKECTSPHTLDSTVTTWADYAISLSLGAILHLILFIYSSMHIKALKKNNIAYIIPALFIIIQILAILTDINEFIRKALAGRYYTSWFMDPAYCYAASSFSRITVPAFYLCLCNLLLVRLDCSFKDSIVALSRCSYFTMMSIAWFVTISVIVSILASNTPCIRYYYANDIDEVLVFCRTNYEGFAEYVVDAGFLFVFLYNLVLGSLFLLKLRKVINQTRGGNVSSSYKIERAMVKNTVLTICTSLSTFITFLVYMNTEGFTFVIPLDMILNCCMLELMYNYNQKYYARCCKPCIVCLLKLYGVKDEARPAFFRGFSGAAVRSASKESEGTETAPKARSIELPAVPDAMLPVSSDVDGDDDQDVTINSLCE